MHGPEASSVNAGGKEEGLHVRVPVSPRGVLRSADLGLQVPSSPQSVNRALNRQKFISMRHRVGLAGTHLSIHPLLLHNQA